MRATALVLDASADVTEAVPGTLVPFALVEDFADRGPDLQNVVDHAPRESWLCIPKHAPFGFKPFDQAVEADVFVGAEMEDSPAALADSIKQVVDTSPVDVHNPRIPDALTFISSLDSRRGRQHHA